jgi:hypothetical protein
MFFLVRTASPVFDDLELTVCGQKNLHEVITLHPSYLTPNLQNQLINLLHNKVEGSCSGQLGYVIAVLQVLDPGRGKVVDGGVEFNIHYQAMVYRPFRGEVVDGVVGSVNKVGRIPGLRRDGSADDLTYRWECLRTLDL